MTEHERRLDSLRAHMAAQGVDLVAIGPTANMRYLAGFVPHPDERLCLLLISAQGVCTVVPKLNAEEGSAHVKLPLYTWADDEGPTAALQAALAGLPAVKSLVVDGAMRADFLLPLQAATQPGQVTPVAPLIGPLRVRKSPEEIEALARAAALADQAMRVAFAACQPGVAESEVAWAVEEALRRDGAQEVDFTLVAAGPNGAYPHHHSGPRRLQAGDAVVIDFGATLDGYKSDVTRMVFLGQPPDEFLQAYAAVLEANTRGREAVRPGVLAKEVDQAALSTLQARGYGDYFVHRTGHGLGLEIHEAPWISAVSETVLEPGMVFSVEPGVYLPGEFGIRIEDIVVVTEDGHRCLTGLERTLRVV